MNCLTLLGVIGSRARGSSIGRYCFTCWASARRGSTVVRPEARSVTPAVGTPGVSSGPSGSGSRPRRWGAADRRLSSSAPLTGPCRRWPGCECHFRQRHRVLRQVSTV